MNQWSKSTVLALGTSISLQRRRIYQGISTSSTLISEATVNRINRFNIATWRFGRMKRPA